jgi:hypothetical protein
MMTTGTTETLMILGHSGKFTAVNSFYLSIVQKARHGGDELRGARGILLQHGTAEKVQVNPPAWFPG